MQKMICDEQTITTLRPPLPAHLTDPVSSSQAPDLPLHRLSWAGIGLPRSQGRTPGSGPVDLPSISTGRSRKPFQTTLF